jgi:hypothetical protein
MRVFAREKAFLRPLRWASFAKSGRTAENMKQAEAEFIRFLRAGSLHAFHTIAISDQRSDPAIVENSRCRIEKALQTSPPELEGTAATADNAAV